MKTELKKVAKTAKHNTVLKKETKNDRDPIRAKSPWMEDYQDFFTHKCHPVSQAFLDRLSCELIEYVENTKTIFRHEWFFTQKRIYPKTARRWAEQNEQFGRVYEVSKFILGMRREDKGLRKEFDSGLISTSMPLYDEEWRNLLEWKSKIAEKNTAPSTVIVQMEPFLPIGE
jgi:hypothetical protein